MGAIHFYAPQKPMNFAMWTAALGSNDTAWQSPILEQVMFAVNWRAQRAQIGIKIPVITTEWGCWMYQARTDGTAWGQSGNLENWANFHLNLFKQHDLGQLWYVGLMDNQGAFALFDSEYGWNTVMLPLL